MRVQLCVTWPFPMREEGARVFKDVCFGRVYTMPAARGAVLVTLYCIGLAWRLA